MSIMSTGLGDAERPATISRRTFTIGEAAKMLGISRNAAYLAAQNGTLPTIMIGRRRLVPRAAFDRLLNGKAPR